MTGDGIGGKYALDIYSSISRFKLHRNVTYRIEFAIAACARCPGAAYCTGYSRQWWGRLISYHSYDCETVIGLSQTVIARIRHWNAHRRCACPLLSSSPIHGACSRHYRHVSKGGMPIFVSSAEPAVAADESGCC